MPEENKGYFANRNISENFYQGFILPKYIRENLPKNTDSNILDIGCGFGQTLIRLRELGYFEIEGVDISEEAVEHCRERDLDVRLINNIPDYILSPGGKAYDFIIMSHVLEHVNKSEIIDTLKLIRSRLLKPGGSLLVVVPNAQSNTGCYWAYEDFTHHTLFTAGSLFYVLKSAGFVSVVFLDTEGTGESKTIVKLAKKMFLKLYSLNRIFWNLITTSSYHKPSPVIYTYDIKALAR